MGMFSKHLDVALMEIVFLVKVNINFYMEIKMIDILNFILRCLWAGTVLAGGRFQTQERRRVF